MNYEEVNGPIDLDMIRLHRKRNLEDGTGGSSISESDMELEAYYLRKQQEHLAKAGDFTSFSPSVELKSLRSAAATEDGKLVRHIKADENVA